MKKIDADSFLMKIYINGKLKTAIYGTKTAYVIDIDKNSFVDMIIENNSDCSEFDVYHKGKFQFYITKEGKPFYRRLDK